MNLPSDVTGDADPAGVVALDVHAVPNPPTEDRFSLVGQIVSRAAVLCVDVAGGGTAGLEPTGELTGRGGRDSVCRFSVDAYQTSADFPRISLRIRTTSGTSLRTVQCTPPDPAPFKPVFEAGLAVPATVCIVGSGPSAVRACARRPSGAFTIALNKAVLMPGLAPDLWLMNQLTSDAVDYFPAATAAAPDVPRLFRLSTALATAAEHAGRDDCFWFIARQAPDEELRADRDLPPGRLVRSGGTVAGCALQIAFALGAREILLCGIDMRGNTYWDGTTNPRDPQPGAWRTVEVLDRLIPHLAATYGGVVCTLGDTALRTPRRISVP